MSTTVEVIVDELKKIEESKNAIRSMMQHKEPLSEVQLGTISSLLHNYESHILGMTVLEKY